jgi:hypothetical protein
MENNIPQFPDPLTSSQKGGFCAAEYSDIILADVRQVQVFRDNDDDYEHT